MYLFRIGRQLFISKEYACLMLFRRSSLLGQNKIICCQYSSSNPSDVARDSPSKIHTFQEVYRFPSIVQYSTFLKVKWHQTLIFFALFPTTGLLYQTDIIAGGTAITALIASAFLVADLYLFSIIFQNTIGFVYISEDERIVKFSYVDFWGERIDEEYPLGDVMIISDGEKSPLDIIYRVVNFYSHNKRLKLFRYNANVTSEDRFKKIFGDSFDELF